MPLAKRHNLLNEEQRRSFSQHIGSRNFEAASGLIVKRTIQILGEMKVLEKEVSSKQAELRQLVRRIYSADITQKELSELSKIIGTAHKLNRRKIQLIDGSILTEYIKSVKAPKDILIQKGLAEAENFVQRYIEREKIFLDLTKRLTEVKSKMRSGGELSLKDIAELSEMFDRITADSVKGPPKNKY